MNEAACFFERLRQRKLDSAQMLKFFLSMGDFCTRTRSDLDLVAQALRAQGHEEYARRLAEIGASEQKHSCSFAQFALELLRQTGHPLVSRLEHDTDTCERLFQSLGGVDDPEVQTAMTWVQELAVSTYAPVFDARRDTACVFYAFGGIRKVEEVAEDDIIRGEVRAFGVGSVYDLNVDTHPALEYLREHVVAEEWHHDFMDEMYASLPKSAHQEADRGYYEATIAFAQWFVRLYDELL